MKVDRLSAKMVILSIVAIVIVYIAFSWYNSELDDRVEESLHSSLLEVTQQMIGNFNTKLESEMASVKMLAALFQNYYPISEDEISKFLMTSMEQGNFDSIGIAGVDGTTITSDKKQNDISREEYFIRALAGETMISNPTMSLTTGREIIVASTPITQKDEIIGVLFASYFTDELNQLLMEPFYNENGYSYVAKQDGTVITKTTTRAGPIGYNVFESLRYGSFNRGDDCDIIKSNMSKKVKGHSHFVLDGNPKVMVYLPLGINDWYFFSIVPQAVMAYQLNSIVNSTRILIAIILVVIALLMLYIGVAQRSHNRTTHEMAYTDSLTGFGNMNKFELDAQKFFEDRKGRSAIVVLDVDKMKVFNDTFGFDSGNALLRAIAQTININLLRSETFARTGGDEFCMLMNFNDDATFLKRIEVIFKAIDESFHLKNSKYYSLVLCAGVYVVENCKEDIHALIDRSRYVHKTTKGKPVSNVAFYDESMKTIVSRQKDIENRMHNALKDREFIVYIQPKYELESEQVVGGEALVRWLTTDIGMIYPNDFIPLFEKNGFVVEVDKYMFESVCKIINRWTADGLQPVTISVNFSRVNLTNKMFVDELSAVAEKYSVPPKYLEIELTETAMMDSEPIIDDVITKLHKAGFSISIDDFGSGYSSLGMLRNSSVDVVKLDRTFFTEYSDHQKANTVISSVVSMVKKLNLNAVAEGVETLEHINFLKEINCDIVQGYYFAKPMPADEFSKYLKKIGGTANA